VNWNPVDELGLACGRMDQLREEWQTANRQAEGKGPGRRTLADLVCGWRTRIGGAVMALGRWIVPAEVRAGLAGPGSLTRC
jgi:hypothetical protein